MKKVCTTCNEEKSTRFFYKRKNGKYGRYAVCIPCHNKVMHLIHKKDPKRVAYQAEYQKKYWHSYKPSYPKGARTKYVKRYEAKNPYKVTAWGMLHEAIRKGLIRKPKRCSRCKKIKRLDGHHYDYDKPLNVWWLCRKCHKDVHAYQKT